MLSGSDIHLSRIHEAKLKPSQEERRNYRTEIPNMVLRDPRIGPYELTLYAHYKSVAGDTGECFQRRDVIVKATGISDGKLSKVRATLVKCGYIEVEEHRPRSTVVRIVDVWDENWRRRGGSPHSVRINPQVVRDESSPGEPEERTSEERTSEEEFHITRAREDRSPTPLREAIRSQEVEVVERFVGGTISLHVVEEISEYRQGGYVLGDFREAIRIADDKGVRSWRFLRGILRQREPGFAAAEERAAAERRKRKPEVARDPERALPE